MQNNEANNFKMNKNYDLIILIIVVVVDVANSKVAIRTSSCKIAKQNEILFCPFDCQREIDFALHFARRRQRLWPK